MSNKREVMYRGRLIKVSEHAKFLATDENGDIFEYSLKPEKSVVNECWLSYEDDVDWMDLLLDESRCDDWQDSLFEIGEEERGND